MPPYAIERMLLAEWLARVQRSIPTGCLLVAVALVLILT